MATQMPPISRGRARINDVCSCWSACPRRARHFGQKKYIQQHPELKFQILSTNLIMERMMPNTKHMYSDRFNKLIHEATDVLNKQLKVAARGEGNIIWDQTNVYASARRRKLQDFYGFHKTAVVFLPPADVHERWRAQHFEETGQRVPEGVVAEMKQHFILPEVGDDSGFDEVVYVFGNTTRESREILHQYKREAEEFFSCSQKRGREDDRAMPPKRQKNEYAKSYGEREFLASNPYEPSQPYTVAGLPSLERQQQLVQHAKQPRGQPVVYCHRPPTDAPQQPLPRNKHVYQYVYSR
eukprot:TRINITY_DN22594_c0_g1_i2.p1 TRINITY_DN22594_c0_g1~~TRINITY_DN22594_c0_g1_i2.p1  ORF type:complete len:297 (+),score=30.45 TRINITY_DN22594_c0_g1_i2:571-1461(+)